MNRTTLSVAGLALLALCPFAVADQRGNWQNVMGTGIHYESDGIEHSVVPTENGYLRRSTDIVELSGDLQGFAVFQPISSINLAEGTIVNTGTQVFSGTVLDSEPVMLHDDGFRFDINVDTQETTGRIYLTDRLSGPVVRCILEMRGTGRTPERYNLSEYWGKCKLNGRK